MATRSTAPIPYETLVDFGVALRRIESLEESLREIVECMGEWILEQLGVGTTIQGNYADMVNDEFLDAVSARTASAWARATSVEAIDHIVADVITIDANMRMLDRKVGHLTRPEEDEGDAG